MHGVPTGSINQQYSSSTESDIVQLPRNEDVLARDTTVLDALANFGLIAVDSSTIDVAVAGFQSNLHSSLDFIRRSLPSTKAYSGDLIPIVEGEMRREGHD
jgi:hypothetical protein